MKKIKFLIIVCIILLIGIIAYLMLDPNARAYRELEEVQVKNEMDDEISIPKGLYKLVATYNGELSAEIIYKSYSHLATNIIPKYYIKYKDLNEDDMRTLYEKNDKLIYTELGYENFNDFLELMQILKTLSGEELIFESYEVEKLSLEKNKGSLSIYLKIKYKDNDEIVLNSYVYNKLNKGATSVVLKTDVDLEKIKEKQEEMNNVSNNIIDNTINNNIVENITLEESEFIMGKPIE